MRSWEGAAAAAAAAAAALAAACCEELLLPPPLVTVDQPPPPPPPTLLELSPTSADDAAAAATAADVDEEASLLSPPAVDGDAPVPVPGAALPPPADQAELTKPEELLSDAEGFCDVLMGEGKRERERVRGKKPDDEDGDDSTPKDASRSLPALDPAASVPPTPRRRSRDRKKNSGDRGRRIRSVFGSKARLSIPQRKEEEDGRWSSRGRRERDARSYLSLSRSLARSRPFPQRWETRWFNIPQGSSPRPAIAASRQEGRRTFPAGEKETRKKKRKKATATSNDGRSENTERRESEGKVIFLSFSALSPSTCSTALPLSGKSRGKTDNVVAVPRGPPGLRLRSGTGRRRQPGRVDRPSQRRARRPEGDAVRRAAARQARKRRASGFFLIGRSRRFFLASCLLAFPLRTSRPTPPFLSPSQRGTKREGA